MGKSTKKTFNITSRVDKRYNRLSKLNIEKELFNKNKVNSGKNCHLFNKYNQIFYSLIVFRHQKLGFTLLELIIVMLFATLLTVLAIPTFTGQIAKSREAEILLYLGAIARTQQSIHFETGQFASTMAQVTAASSIPATTKYYRFLEPTADVNKVKHQVEPLPSQTDVRHFAIGVYFENGGYPRATCQGFAIGETVNVGDSPSDPCTNNGKKIK